jgi:hypothetical protein
LCLPFDAALALTALDLGTGWSGRWSATWRLFGSPVTCAVRDLASMPRAGCRPVRRFSWQAGQRHRPGLQYLASTGRHHGFESVAEQRLLLALDFAADLTDALSQPFRLRFATGEGWRAHIPDFLALTGAGAWLVDVRPAGRVAGEDRVCFAAAAEVALSCGWRYTVVTGWRSHVMTTVDTLSAQRRPLTDQLGLQEELLAGVADGPRRFGELVSGTRMPAVGRAHLLHLLWRRRLGIGVDRPLIDASLVWSPAEAGR